MVLLRLMFVQAKKAGVSGSIFSRSNRRAWAGGEVPWGPGTGLGTSWCPSHNALTAARTPPATGEGTGDLLRLKMLPACSTSSFRKRFLCSIYPGDSPSQLSSTPGQALEQGRVSDHGEGVPGVFGKAREEQKGDRAKKKKPELEC